MAPAHGMSARKSPDGRITDMEEPVKPPEKYFHPGLGTPCTPRTPRPRIPSMSLA